jgi:hypothetical protein
MIIGIGTPRTVVDEYLRLIGEEWKPDGLWKCLCGLVQSGELLQIVYEGDLIHHYECSQYGCAGRVTAEEDSAPHPAPVSAVSLPEG